MKVDDTQWVVGDACRWTHVSGKGRHVTLTLRCGVILAISEDDDTAVIEKPSGRRERVALRRLRTPEQKSQVTEFVEAIVGVVVESMKGTEV